MATQITNYQCPACTGPLHFQGSTGKLECEYCGSAFEVAEIEALYADKLDKAEAAGVQAQAKPAELWGAEGENLRAYSCPSCGAELFCEETTAATSCPYCGNPTVVPGQFHAERRPDFVLPFKLDKEAAITALKKYYKGKKLLPKSFTEHNHIEEIKGVYVPFWLYDAKVDADIHYAATRSHSHRSGDYRVTVTEHYAVRRAGTVDFERIPVDASTRMPDAHMDAIEPFDYRELKPFSTAYLPGFLADVYDVTADEGRARAETRAHATASELMAESVLGYTTCVPVDSHVELGKCDAKYALLPVWMLSTRWNGKSFLFAMNGQTGRLIGDLPVSMGRYWAWFFGIAAPLAALLALLLFL